MANVRLQINTKGYIDLPDSNAVPLTLTRAEIQDISKRQGSYTKTIDIPNTPFVQELFSSIFDVNIFDGTFDPNKKEECYLLQNGTVIIDGYLQLSNIVKLNEALLNPDEQITYQVLIKDEISDFFTSMGDKYLTDLTGWTQYNHAYKWDNVTATKGKNWLYGYKYHCTYHDKNEYNLKDFTPNIFAFTYLHKIFEQGGYTFEWPEAAAMGADRLIIPYNGDAPLADFEDYGFRAGYLTPQVIPNVVTGPTNTYPLKFDDDFNFPNTDPASSYNIANGVYDSNFIGNAKFKVRYTYKIEWDCAVAAFWGDPGYLSNDRKLSVNLFHKVGALTVPTLTTLLTQTIKSSFLLTSGPGQLLALNPGLTLIEQGIIPEIETTAALQIGTKIVNWIEGGVTQTGFVWRGAAISGPILAGGNIPKLKVTIAPIQTTNFNKNYFLIQDDIPLSENLPVKLQNFIPLKLKQRDFVSGLVNMFNLYIRKDRKKTNHFVIQTRDNFYDEGGALDWTDKIDMQSEINLQLLPDLQDKKIIFSYKSDSDDNNKKYLSSAGEIYGQYQYTFVNNEFTKSTKNIQPIFSPTPIVYNKLGFLVPSIDSISPKNNIRILFDNDWVDVNTIYGTGLVFKSQPTSTPILYAIYPFMSHLSPDPFNPTLDLNYGTNDYYFYDTYAYLTNSNLYNKYWRRYVSQIETGKLMSCRIRLNEFDMNNLDFRNKIFIHDAYWYLNKIIDYNPNGDGLTTVELISVDDGTKFEPTQVYTYNNPGIPPGTLNPNPGGGIGPVGNQRTAQNQFGSHNDYLEIIGYNNIVQANSLNFLGIGNQNNYFGDHNLIVGDNLNVQSSNVFSFGVSNATIREAGIYFNGPTRQYVNFISAGRDEILNAFPPTKLVNRINAGRDIVRNVGGESIETNINAGINFII